MVYLAMGYLVACLPGVEVPSVASVEISIAPQCGSTGLREVNFGQQTTGRRGNHCMAELVNSRINLWFNK